MRICSGKNRGRRPCLFATPRQRKEIEYAEYRGTDRTGQGRLRERRVEYFAKDNRAREGREKKNI